ncbi:PREDICTED: mannose-P-dolichol utilization defect 1 protein [Nanorana parkeri]|uniref:mannose-P-dolichol utilization defect 1 protein n=1 Tax=Nanorana parkeri TaxID=125878 RepID=UPI00085421A4|nr:PREDICTED: mannose-P-dolichol utilization defect 1 protein [Nanorana parkeri]
MEALRGVLVPAILPESCYDEFFLQYNLLHATAPDYCSFHHQLPLITALSTINCPLSLPSIALRVNGWLCLCSAWGEVLFLMIQTLVIGFLIQHLGSRTNLGILLLGIYFSIVAVLLSPVVPMAVVTVLQATNVPAVIISRLIQVMTNYRNGHTGQLSAITVTLLFLGSLARIFTSVQETGDPLMALTYVVSSACNGLIFAQLMYYWNAGPAGEKKRN